MKTGSVPKNLHSKLTQYVRSRAKETLASGDSKAFASYRDISQRIREIDEQNSHMFNHIGLINEYVSTVLLG